MDGFTASRKANILHDIHSGPENRCASPTLETSFLGAPAPSPCTGGPSSSPPVLISAALGGIGVGLRFS